MASAEAQRGERPSRRVDRGVDFATRKCITDIQAAETFSMETLLAVIDGNSVACEALSEESVLLRSRVEALLEDARQKARDLVWGLEEPRVSSSFVGAFFGPREHETAASPDGAPELACGRQAAQKAISLLAELDGLGQRLEKLRISWPDLRASIAHAREAREPFRSGTLTLVLGEALSWRQSFAAALCNSEPLCAQLCESIERCHAVEVERQRWRELTQRQLSEMDKPVAARVGAVLWARRGGPRSEGAALEPLAQSLEAAEVLQRRLVRCASALLVASREAPEAPEAPEAEAASRLAALKHSLCLAAERASAVERQLVEAPAGGARDRDERLVVSQELRALFAAADRVSLALAGCPLDLEDGEPRGAAPPDLEALGAWAREHLLRDARLQARPT